MGLWELPASAEVQLRGNSQQLSGAGVGFAISRCVKHAPELPTGEDARGVVMEYTKWESQAG